MRTSDTISGVVLIVLAGVMIALTATFPPFPGQKFGPALFPRLLGSAMILCGVLLIWRDRIRAGGGPTGSIAPWLGEPWRVVSFLLVLGAPLLAIMAWDSVGFVPIGVVTLATLFLWFRVRPVTAIATAIIVTVLLQIFFGKLMRVPLPLGWLLQLPPGWLGYVT